MEEEEDEDILMEILEISRFFLIGVLGENIVFENKVVLEE